MRMRGHDFHCNPASSREEPATVRLLGWRMVAWSRLSRNSWHDYALMTMAREGVKDNEIGEQMVLLSFAAGKPGPSPRRLEPGTHGDRGRARGIVGGHPGFHLDGPSRCHGRRDG